MRFPSLCAALAGALLLSAPGAAQEPVPADGDKTVREAPSVPYADPGESTQLLLKYGTFDPARGVPAIPPALQGGEDTGLFVVQFVGAPTDADRAAVRAAGAEIHGYLPHDAYVVRMGRDAAGRVAQLANTRAVVDYHPAFRLERFLILEHLSGAEVPVRRYNVVVVDKRRDKPALVQAIAALGGRVVDELEGSLLLEADLDGAQLLATARLDQVLWIDRWSAPELDMDNARIQGGANYVETQLGYTGQGVRGHVYEGVQANHPDFTTPMTNVASSGAARAHGHATAGIVFGNGTSNPAVRGMAPDAVGFYTEYSSFSGSRNQVVGQLVNTHDVMFTTASWGNARTRQYTSVSADSDDVIFDHRIPWTQSQSNAGNQDSRPQAWAKNIFSIGGVAHRNNPNPGDDSWGAGGASTGPAADGRIKPDLCAYYDNIGTSDLTGSAGYSNGDWTSNFGGTSGATPIVAGHNAIAIQMFTDGVFGNALRVPGGTRFQNRPYAQTLKALMLANAEQYPFGSSSGDNRREHQGWGFPSLRNLYDNSNRMLVVAEDDVVTQGAVRSYTATVQVGEPELKVCMTFLEPAGNPSAAQAAVNDLTLRVTAPDGTVYWGNHGLTVGNYSVVGGSADTRDSVECVFVRGPQAGDWTIEVLATRISQDAHVATPGVDATYALCAVGVNASGTLPRFTPYGSGCGPVGNSQLPATFYQVFGSFDLGGRALRFTPTGQGDYVVTECTTAGCFDTNVGPNLGLRDDQLSRNHALGFSFPVPGRGTTSSIDIDSNGWVGLFSGQHPGSDYTETVAEFLGDPARIAVLWDDLNPSARGSVHFTARPGVALVTWQNVPEFSNTGSNTAQLQLYPNGEFVLAYGSVGTGDCLVGLSQGGGVADPGPNDLDDPSGGSPLRIGANAAPRIGQNFDVSVSNLPQGTTLAALNLGVGRQSIDLTRLGMEGCSLLTTVQSVVAMQQAGGVATAPFVIPNNTAFLGAVLYTQAISASPGANARGALTSDAATIVVGN